MLLIKVLNVCQVQINKNYLLIFVANLILAKFELKNL